MIINVFAVGVLNETTKVPCCYSCITRIGPHPEVVHVERVTAIIIVNLLAVPQAAVLEEEYPIGTVDDLHPQRVGVLQHVPEEADPVGIHVSNAGRVPERIPGWVAAIRQ